MPSKSGYEQLKSHEGFIPKVTIDRTENGKKLRNRVIGYGYNIDSADNPEQDLIKAGVPEGDVNDILQGRKPIDEGHASSLFDLTVRRAAVNAQAVVSNFNSLEKPVQDILINMSYQLGRDGLREFKKMRTALLNEDYSTAAKEILNSKFAREDTPKRAEALAKQMSEYAKQKSTTKVKPQRLSASEQYRQDLAHRLSKTYSKQMITDRLAKGISTMMKNQSLEKESGDGGTP